MYPRGTFPRLRLRRLPLHVRKRAEIAERRVRLRPGDGPDQPLRVEPDVLRITKRAHSKSQASGWSTVIVNVRSFGSSSASRTSSRTQRGRHG